MQRKNIHLLSNVEMKVQIHWTLLQLHVYVQPHLHLHLYLNLFKKKREKKKLLQLHLGGVAATSTSLANRFSSFIFCFSAHFFPFLRPGHCSLFSPEKWVSFP
jgi:hypothetical protein